MNSKFFTALAAAGLLTSATAANAADIIEPAAAPAPEPAVFSWTGFYLGGTVGGSWAESKNRLKQNGRKIAHKKLKPDGVIGGIYTGYNYQLANNIVLGAETDWLWDDVNDGAKRQFGKRYGKIRSEQKWNGATRLRAGYAFDRFLPYFAAGVSYADVSNSVRVFGADNKRLWKKSKGDTRAGWNVGVGVDYAPNFAFLGPVNDHLVVRAEYRFTDFGKKNYKLPNSIKYHSEYNQNDFRIGAAYKF